MQFIRDVGDLSNDFHAKFLRFFSNRDTLVNTSILCFKECYRTYTGPNGRLFGTIQRHRENPRRGKLLFSEQRALKHAIPSIVINRPYSDDEV